MHSQYGAFLGRGGHRNGSAVPNDDFEGDKQTQAGGRRSCGLESLVATCTKGLKMTCIASRGMGVHWFLTTIVTPCPMALNQKEYGKCSISVLHGIAQQIRQNLAHPRRIKWGIQKNPDAAGRLGLRDAANDHMAMLEFTRACAQLLSGPADQEFRLKLHRAGSIAIFYIRIRSCPDKCGLKDAAVQVRRAGARARSLRGAPPSPAPGGAARPAPSGWPTPER